ncbi:AcrR family transcriptional regulator [Mycobacterium frederiksbergense]|uniref:AcrR family transcriptional regulator n=1 Tax=Mycolicibacterium frederiksbergense TaxID=117567 RepID=A0ABT6KTC3_9MYCO|nr:TetR family transcriptional regulator C-terminal domain-containing protein [Mycolicibacterium frederiksbergense]MDH6193976.1 AcrR family transcriptional regulator [Mycolicibacterium frederiksbergense]
MPIRVDPEQRRSHIVEAALRLVVSDGLNAATFRRVAVESGLNIGSVRHYFSDHESLIVAVVTEAGSRMGQRLMKHTPPNAKDDADQRRYLVEVLEELVPLDTERHREAIILMEVIAASRTNAAFHPVTMQMAADLDAVLLEALTNLGVPEPILEARRLASLLSGLSLDAVTAHGTMKPELIRNILRLHVNALPTNSNRP